MNSNNFFTRPTVKIIKVISAVFVAVISWMNTAYFAISQAQIRNPAVGPWGTNPNEAQTGGTFAKAFVYFWNVAIVVGGLIVLVFFIQAAIEWITAGGDSGKIQKARERIIQSFIGLAILVFSFTIINFIGALLFGNNFSLLDFNLPNPASITAPSG